MMENYMESKFDSEKIKKLIESNSSIAIFHHIEPDGDCIGASRALYHILKLNYPQKDVYWVGNNHGKFLWIEEMESDEDKVDFKNTLGIVVDVAPSSRIEKFELLKRCTKGIIRIDHHPNAADYDITAVYLDKDSPATCQIITELSIKYEWKISKQISTYLYLGLITDSSRFLYRSVTNRTYDVASFLYKNEADRGLVHNHIYKKTKNELKLEGIILNNLKIEDKVAYFYINNKILADCGLKHNQAIMIDVLGGIEGVKAWVMFNEFPGYIRTELRCVQGYKINSVAFKFNGGGHDQASGCKIDSEDKIKDVIKEVKELVKE